MNKQKVFESKPITQGALFDLKSNRFPCNVTGFCAENDAVIARAGCKGTTTFGFVYEGPASINYNGMQFQLSTGMYFTIPGEFSLSGSKIMLIEYGFYNGFFNIGGPVENFGRLKYINGCTDSLLCFPLRKGDPCLNALYFPPGIKQTPHTHPSYRIGIVVEGNGHCITEAGEIPLEKGQVFVVLEEGIHSFNTERSFLNIVSFHPDSDFGPADEDHPMINRTIIDGKSANKSKYITGS